MATVSSTLPAHTAQAWLQRWDAQQEFYIPDREERFAVIGDVVGEVIAEIAEPVIVDLGCGPGSLAARLHERFPHARIFGVDSDPLLLGLGQAAYGDALTWVDGDLGQDDWLAQVPEVIQVAVSTTALHWMPTAKLAALYRALGLRVPVGGAVINGDHLELADEKLQALASTVRAERIARVGTGENEDWRHWWDAILVEPDFAELVAARTQRVASPTDTAASTALDGMGDEKVHHGSNRVGVDGHRDLLRQAGFRASAPVWQSGDDHVLVGLR